jgi:uncharacterized protein (DUF849 family)
MGVMEGVMVKYCVGVTDGAIVIVGDDRVGVENGVWVEAGKVKLESGT